MMSIYIKEEGVKVNMTSIQRYFCACLFLLLPITAHTGSNVTRDIIEVSPGIGYYNFDGDRNIEDTAMATVGLGLHFSRQWLMLLHYSALDYDSDRPKVVMQKYHVDAHYFFNTKNAFRPYIVAGFGQLDFDTVDIQSTKNMFNAGLGVSYKITPSWFVRTDARIFQSTNGDFQDNALTLTLGYRFSGGEKSE